MTHPVLHGQDHQVAVGVGAGRGLQGVVVPSLPAAVALAPFPAASAGLSSLPAAPHSCPGPNPPFPATPHSPAQPSLPAPAHGPGSPVLQAPSWFSSRLPPLPAAPYLFPLQAASPAPLPSSVTTPVHVLVFIVVATGQRRPPVHSADGVASLHSSPCGTRVRVGVHGLAAAIDSCWLLSV